MPVSEITEVLLSKELKLLSTRRLKQSYVCEVEKHRQAFEICPKCASPSNVRAGRVSVTVREEPLRDSWIWLKIHKHRYYCKKYRN